MAGWKRPALGFTLVELLIVVAIIGILVAIAVPNFLNAVIRARVSQAYAEMRTLATALEAYHVDNHDYPPDAAHDPPPPPENAWQGVGSFIELTSPIAYISSVPPDPFHDKDQAPLFIYYTYKNFAPPDEPDVVVIDGVIQDWVLYSFGPDQDADQVDWNPVIRRYDPTNGIVSDGDLNRWGP